MSDPAATAERRVGEVIADKWRLERVLGIGGMASVFAATHKNNLRPAAIKVLHAELAANTDIRRRFLREGYIANRVGHPNSVAILDDGEAEDGTVFLVMELLVGESLADRRDRGKLGEVEALRVADGVLDVLAAAHEQGIVHRDLKPDNVFLTKDGAVKVLDFGIARLLDGRPGDVATMTGVTMGTPAYMPPEQAAGRTSEVDERSDLWSLGAILFACLTGRHVHDAETPQEALIRAMTSPAPALRAIATEADKRVAAIVDRALKLERDDRWPDARTMQKAVREALAAMEPTMLAPTSGPPSREAPPVSGQRVVTAVTKEPIVQEVPPSRGGGGRLLVVLIGLGGLAFGLNTLLRAKPLSTAAGFDPPVVAAPPIATIDASVAVAADDAAATGALVASGDADSDAGLVTDAGTGDGAIDDAGEPSDADVDADDEYDDDDGGDDEEDEVIDAAAPHRSSASPAHATHPGKKAAPPKKRHKKKKRRH